MPQPVIERTEYWDKKYQMFSRVALMNTEQIPFITRMHQLGVHIRCLIPLSTASYSSNYREPKHDWAYCSVTSCIVTKAPHATDKLHRPKLQTRIRFASLSKEKNELQSREADIHRSGLNFFFNLKPAYV